jgi:hypothetical protein
MEGLRLGPGDPWLTRVLALDLAGAIVLLPWLGLLLVLLPPATAAFARSRRPLDLFDLPASLRLVRSRFAEWNLVVAGIVTAWVIGLAAGGLLCLGAVPGLLYAILVSSHATASLGPRRPSPG